jgi:hypothetical protein
MELGRHLWPVIGEPSDRAAVIADSR